ncbi:MAG: oligosaccharide flippase family protein [Mobilicoccus sp.]|nr:oligosaccharide flippase family protein [Mobilicoccus sp.]
MSLRRRDLLPGLVLFAGTALGALLGYAFFAVLGRSLPKDDLGAVGALVNLVTILTVPGVGLQLATARRVAAGRSGGVGVADVVAAIVVGGVPAVLLAVCAPLVVQALHLSSPAPVLVIAASAVPMTLVFMGMGAVQGAERFALLSLVQFSTGAVKFAAALVAAFLGLGVLGVLSWWAVGWVVLTVAVLWPAIGRRRTSSSAAGPASGAAVGAGLPARVSDVWRDSWAIARAGAVSSVPLAGLFVLSGLDLLLARHYLPGDASGVYTVGSLFAKVAFWGPQFLATFFYPRMARPDQRRAAVLAAVGSTALVGVVGIGVAALAGDLLVRIVGGPAFVEPLGSLAWVFTALGVGLALVQVCVYADLARSGRAVGVAVWVAVAAVFVVVAVAQATPVAIVIGVTSCVGVLVALALGIVWATTWRDGGTEEGLMSSVPHRRIVAT